MTTNTTTTSQNEQILTMLAAITARLDNLLSKFTELKAARHQKSTPTHSDFTSSGSNHAPTITSDCLRVDGTPPPLDTALLMAPMQQTEATRKRVEETKLMGNGSSTTLRSGSFKDPNPKTCELMTIQKTQHRVAPSPPPEPPSSDLHAAALPEPKPPDPCFERGDSKMPPLPPKPPKSGLFTHILGLFRIATSSFARELIVTPLWPPAVNPSPAPPLKPPDLVSAAVFGRVMETKGVMYEITVSPTSMPFSMLEFTLVQVLTKPPPPDSGSSAKTFPKPKPPDLNASVGEHGSLMNETLGSCILLDLQWPPDALSVQSKRCLFCASNISSSEPLVPCAASQARFAPLGCQRLIVDHSPPSDLHHVPNMQSNPW